ncbi:hypothetical protein [Winogradskyella flava]|uniref:hypothetical protein n=1 Tax=Winogradskyella flava TaxID=1884876 RepID=UPI002492F9EF|nr:hypothetical protein [Winogradskyella flava]
MKKNKRMDTMAILGVVFTASGLVFAFLVTRAYRHSASDLRDSIDNNTTENLVISKENKEISERLEIATNQIQKLTKKNDSIVAESKEISQNNLILSKRIDNASKEILKITNKLKFPIKDDWVIKHFQIWFKDNQMRDYLRQNNLLYDGWAEFPISNKNSLNNPFLNLQGKANDYFYNLFSSGKLYVILSKKELNEDLLLSSTINLENVLKHNEQYINDRESDNISSINQYPIHIHVSYRDDLEIFILSANLNLKLETIKIDNKFSSLIDLKGLKLSVEFIDFGNPTNFTKLKAFDINSGKREVIYGYDFEKNPELSTDTKSYFTQKKRLKIWLD